MIDVSKVRMMTKLAIYEKGKGKKELKMHRYSMRAYVSLKLLGSFFAVTAAYGFGACLYVMRYYSNIIVEGLAFSYHKIFINLMIVYGIIMIINIIATGIIQRKRYIKMMKNMKQYDKDLFMLKKYLEKEQLQ